MYDHDPRLNNFVLPLEMNNTVILEEIAHNVLKIDQFLFVSCQKKF